MFENSEFASSEREREKEIHLSTLFGIQTGGSMFLYGQGFKEWKNPKNDLNFA